MRSDAAFQAVIDAESFFVARGIIQERNRVFTDEEMLAKLRQLHAQHRELSASLIDDADGVPTSSSFRNRFGSLIEAYRLIGLPASSKVWKCSRLMGRGSTWDFAVAVQSTLHRSRAALICEVSIPSLRPNPMIVLTRL